MQTPEPLAALCLAASEDIRLRRSIAFSHPVTLTTGTLRLRFDPIEGPTHALRVPFRVRYEDGDVVGWMRLWKGNPVPLAFERPPASGIELAVWASIILAFSDLTVWPEEVVSSGPSPRPMQRLAISSRGKPATKKSLAPRQRRRYPEHQRGLTWGTLQAHFVVAHRRWLPEGYEASAEKIEEAARVGIRLAPGQTWVTGHVRGGERGAAKAAPLIGTRRANSKRSWSGKQERSPRHKRFPLAISFSGWTLSG